MELILLKAYRNSSNVTGKQRIELQRTAKLETEIRKYRVIFFELEVPMR